MSDQSSSAFFLASRPPPPSGGTCRPRPSGERRPSFQSPSELVGFARRVARHRARREHDLLLVDEDAERLLEDRLELRERVVEGLSAAAFDVELDRPRVEGPGAVERVQRAEVAKRSGRARLRRSRMPDDSNWKTRRSAPPRRDGRPRGRRAGSSRGPGAPPSASGRTSGRRRGSSG